jgi:hypothetical protein
VATNSPKRRGAIKMGSTPDVFAGAAGQHVYHTTRSAAG